MILMSNIQDDLDIINKEINRLVEDLKVEVKEFQAKEIEIPDWKEVQKKKNLYQGYKEVTVSNNELNKLLLQLGDVILAVKDLKNSLTTSEDMPPRLLKKVRNNLDNKISKLYQYQKILKNEKDSYDQTLRFYNSAQYILGSPRLSGME